MPRIQQLSTSVVNKIAAGEVIERPASVVKELVENSLDAGATRVDVTVEQGGMELIRVVDNGGGIPADELTLAVASHATSKLRTADDLFQVATMGFRGEALASIAEVSRFSLRSRPPEENAGAELEVVGGQLSPITPCSSPPGTTIEVRNLFFNTPVRRKFMRAAQTELGHIGEAFTRIALAYPQVHFTLRHNNRAMHELPPTDDLRERIGRFFGPELADELIWLESRDEQVELSGYVARPSQSRSHNKMQYLFLNGRAIRDRALQHALSEAYRGLILTGRYPITFLNIRMPADLVDVNVHPTKLEVRFQDGSRLYSQLLGTLRTKFLTTDLTHKLEPVGAAATNDDPAGAHDPAIALERRRELVDWAKGQLASVAPTALPSGNDYAAPPVTRQPVLDFAALRSQHAPLTVNRVLPPRGELRSDSVPAPHMSPPVVASPSATPHSALPTPHLPTSRALQLHNRYLITESAEGMIVIDQHALHERVLYEQLREKVLSGALETQQLLVPEPVDLSPAEAGLVKEHAASLAQVGLNTEPFGGDTILVTSYPAMLRHFRPAEVLRAMVDQLASGNRQLERRDLIDELLHMMSCKAAVKAGDPLTPDEVDALLEQRHLAQDTHHCPHGRPTMLVFTKEELDKQFKRT
ncbi:MAG: DNA mismatch repair endonuclease MutL [Planctomycetaceae bacterium]|nr:DNA mismatch repair endonuclease MutL [Planctomycetaceae bacterium]